MSVAKIVERLSHNKATVGTEKQRLECWRLKKLLYEDLNDLIYVYVYVYVYYFQKATASAESVDTSWPPWNKIKYKGLYFTTTGEVLWKLNLDEKKSL